MWSLLGFTTWTLLLILGVVLYRVGVVLSGKRPANGWQRGRPLEGPEFIQRMVDAHANCLENLPLFGAVILVAAVTGRGALTDPLAIWYLALRVGQSTVHLVGTSHWYVQIRFALFFPQLILLGWMMVRLAVFPG
jgi:uncharacterized MAPEG superfamily protein